MVEVKDTETEICEAESKCISQELPLRAYLESLMQMITFVPNQEDSNSLCGEFFTKTVLHSALKDENIRN